MTSKVNYGYFSGVGSGIAGNDSIYEQKYIKKWA